MDDLNSTKTRDELTNELNIAQASYDGTKVAELEAAIKALDEKGDEHKIEMTEATQKVEVEEKMKMEDLIRKLQDKPENAKENAKDIVDQAKSRLKETIDRYVTKIKELKNTTGSEKEQLTKDLETARAELKAEKNRYETAKNYFMGELKYTPEELSKISTRRIRFGKKTVKGWIVTQTLTERLQFSTMKRRMTINTLIKKFNKIGDKPADGIRFIMGFDKGRFLRYTSAKLSTGIDQLGWKIGLQMNPQQFHEKFNVGKNNILSILDKWEKTEEEKKVIDAIKNRINYYGYAYARQRASAWTNPFINAEKNATEKDKIIQMTPPNDLAKTG